MPKIAEQPLFVNVLESNEDGEVFVHNNYECKVRQENAKK
tara:strand:+ start:609 stop:728 length:120 start_codon:yes stop_codon:yes gene_type:complete